MMLMTSTAVPTHRIPSLDGVRAISILLVIIGHGATRAYPTAGLVAAFGVQVFFVISGYLITTLLQKERERAGSIGLLAFYRRRTFRIFPAAFAYIAIIALISPPARPDLPYALTYTFSYHPVPASYIFMHLWSLSVEEQFYLLWPLALVLGFRYRGRIAMAVIFLAAMFRLGCTITSPAQTVFLLHYSFPGVMDSIAVGCLLAVYESEVHKRYAWMVHHALLAASLPIGTLLLALALWSHNAAAVCWGIIPLLVALCVFLAIKRQDWVLNNPVASAIGVLSYSLYLWQQPFIFHLRDGLAIYGLSTMVLFAFLSYALIEKPMLKLGASIKSRNAPLC